MFEFVDHQPIAIDAQALLGDGRASHIVAQALEFVALTGFAAHHAAAIHAHPNRLDERVTEAEHDLPVVGGVEALSANMTETLTPLGITVGRWRVRTHERTERLDDFERDSFPLAGG